jgi:hypothetical protein
VFPGPLSEAQKLCTRRRYISSSFLAECQTATNFGTTSTCAHHRIPLSFPRLTVSQQRRLHLRHERQRTDVERPQRPSYQHPGRPPSAVSVLIIQSLLTQPLMHVCVCRIPLPLRDCPYNGCHAQISYRKKPFWKHMEMHFKDRNIEYWCGFDDCKCKLPAARLCSRADHRCHLKDVIQHIYDTHLGLMWPCVCGKGYQAERSLVRHLNSKECPGPAIASNQICGICNGPYQLGHHH